MEWDCDAQLWLVGFMIRRTEVRPAFTMSAWGQEEYTRKKKQIAEQLYKIKEWKIIQGDYYDIPNQECTWFIDPPYQYGGNRYTYHDIDYVSLRKWCKERQGQTIVCENSKADWIELEPLIKNSGIKHTTMECIWTNDNESKLF